MILRMRDTRCMILGILRIECHGEARLSHTGCKAVWLLHRFPGFWLLENDYEGLPARREPWLWPIILGRFGNPRSARQGRTMHHSIYIGSGVNSWLTRREKSIWFCMKSYESPGATEYEIRARTPWRAKFRFTELSE